MNDNYHQFEMLVRRIVARVIASPSRRRSMRDELLGHLQSIYEEEIGAGRNEQAAIDSAIVRIGDAAELSRQLQSTVPFFERFIFAWFTGQELPMTRWPWIVGTLGVFVGFAFMLGLSILMPAVARLVKEGRSPANDMVLKGSLMGLLGFSVMLFLAGIVFLIVTFIKRRQAGSVA